ncbi:MAG: TIGR03767 family metallophosphoesterase [Candidatus Dormibacteraeota bacterium]|nr:TIGR03767 family metallophosphoesterase [Candidatus Dormibacteraeota bacterium]
MSGRPPALTVRHRLDAGPVQRRGSLGAYRSVAAVEGEPHSVRSELVGATLGGSITFEGRPITCLAHITDLHATDVESPARFEFINRYYADPRFRELLPMHRAQEALNAHVIDAMVQTINRIGGGPLTGCRPELVAVTGDAVDNVQGNELAACMALLDGGLVQPKSGGPDYEGVQSPSWPDDLFWKPDGSPEGDQYRKALGFPSMPGLLERALQPFHATGFGLPWLGCHGNHEEVCQGVGVVNRTLAAATVGTRKAFRLPDGLDLETVVETFVQRPEAFMSGPYVDVTPDRARRQFSLGQFVDAHFHSRARPRGHGFAKENIEQGTAYYVHDTPAVRFITLDTACPGGGAEGCISATQLNWLERRLEEVHSSFRSRHDTTVSTSKEDRLVVVLSHHPFDTLTNRRAHPSPGAIHADPRDLLAMLLRFPNVVLWLNGHIHANRVRAHGDSGAGRGGFWEVTTASLVDWPCQGRVVELVETGDGLLAIACTMVDHEGSALADLHRELAANAPEAGFRSGRAGTPADRNVILPVRAPFSLDRLHSA